MIIKWEEIEPGIIRGSTLVENYSICVEVKVDDVSKLPYHEMIGIRASIIKKIEGILREAILETASLP